MAASGNAQTRLSMEPTEAIRPADQAGEMAEQKQVHDKYPSRHSISSQDQEHEATGAEDNDTPKHSPYFSSSSVVRKVDLLLMPFLLLLFGFQYADKAVLGSAAVGGILTDLQLSVPSAQGSGAAADLTRYSTATALFYAGYAVSVLPAAIIATKVKNVVHYLGAMVVLWGAIVLLTPAISTYKGLYAQRFFLGAVESTVSPGFVLITRSWYLRSEHASRLGVWYSATGLFSIVSGLVNFGLTSIKNGSLPPWKVLYLFAGSFTIAFGLLFIAIVPKDPETRPLIPIKGYNVFNSKQRAQLRQRVLAQRGASQSQRLPSVARWRKEELLESLLDVKLHLFFLMAFAIYLVNGAVTGFGAQIVKNIYGYTGAHAIALQSPGGATTALSIYLVGYLSLKIPNSRIALLCTSCLPVIVGALMIWLGPWSNRGVVLAGLYLLPIFGAPFVMLLSLATANVQGQLKSAIASGYIFVGYALSNIAAPYTFRGPELPVKYRTTWITIISCMCATIGLALLLAAKLYLDNRKKQKQVSDRPTTPQASGVTDVEDETFRYVF